MSDAGTWRPTASLATLRRRAEALRGAREFFRARDVLEVETPALVNAPVSDVNLASVRVDARRASTTRRCTCTPRPNTR